MFAWPWRAAVRQMAIGLLPVLAVLAWRWRQGEPVDALLAAGCGLAAVGLPLWHALRPPRQAAGDGAARCHPAIDSHVLPMWIYDVRSLRIVDVNEAAIALYGHAREAFVGRSIADLRPPEDEALLRERIDRIVDDRAPPDQHRWRHRLADGRLITVDMYGRWLAGSGRTQRVVCVIDRSSEQDALEALLRLRAELEQAVADRTAQLEARETTYRLLAELSPQILWQADARGRITYVSNSWYRLVGMVEGDSGMPRWLAATHPDDRAATLQAFETASREGQPMRVRRRYRSPGGGYRTFLSVGAPVLSPAGRFSGWVGVDTDITELEQHAARLAQTNAELEAMSYTVSHDLRAPVQVIKGFVDAVLAGQIGHVDAPAHGALLRVQRNAQRMDELLTDLLELSRLAHATLHPQRLDPLCLARDTALLMQDRYPQRTIALEAAWADAPAPAAPALLWADRRLFQAVLENLLDNAVKYSPGPQACRIEVLAHCTHDHLVLRVCDRGVGFPEELADRLFLPFQRLHAADQFKGTGVGLATVQRIMHLHGGTIDAHNREGGGAVFTLRLPLPPAEGGEDAPTTTNTRKP